MRYQFGNDPQSEAFPINNKEIEDNVEIEIVEEVGQEEEVQDETSSIPLIDPMFS